MALNPTRPRRALVWLAALALTATLSAGARAHSELHDHDDNAAEDIQTSESEIALPPREASGLTNLRGGKHSKKYFYVVVPDGIKSMTISSKGGTGDADLFVRYKSRPTLKKYQCRSSKAGNKEKCVVHSPKAGKWQIMLYGYSSYKKVVLTAKLVTTSPQVPEVQNNVPVPDLAGDQDSNKFYFITVPEGQSNLNVGIGGGTGDVDLYVKYGAAPTTDDYDCRPYATGNNEACVGSNPAAGKWYIMLHGFTSYSGVTLTASYGAGGDCGAKSIAPTSQSISKDATTGSIQVTAPAGCGWTAVSNADWISVTGGSSGVGDGTVSYSVAANSGPARSNTITVADQSFTISQDAGSSATVVDVFVAYTTNAKTDSSNILAEINLAVALTNTAYSNSGVNTTLRLVGTQEVNYNEGAFYGGLNTEANYTGVLCDLTGISCVSIGVNNNQTATFSGVRALRDSTAADLVVLIRRQGSACGVAWVHDPPSANTDYLGYAVVTRDYGCIDGNSFAHETGHLQGLLHDRYVQDPAPASKYNYGYVDTVGQFREIMSYPDKCGTCQRIPYFSTPLKTYNGRPLGIPQGQSEASDGTRALNESSGITKDFR